MNIGFVSTWLHRGAAYVTINYAKLLMPEHNVFVFARAGEYFDKSLHEEGIEVYPALRIGHKTEVLYSEFRRWIIKNNIQMVIWNEQRELDAIVRAKSEFPTIPHGAYIDYYTEETIEDFSVYDFLICNTKRHFSVFNWHPQVFYLPWGCDTNLYKPRDNYSLDNQLVFFHSMGMSDRKGTDVLINVFREHELYKYNAKLVIHAQIDISHLISDEEAAKYGIEIVNKTVAAPGLYYLGNVYVYPAKLDGLGLTLYEAISCGLPVIATDIPPMNEVICEQSGQLIKVKRLYSRSDGYYWPQAEVDEESLFQSLMYYVNHRDELGYFSEQARSYAVANWSLSDRKRQLQEIIATVCVIDNSSAQRQYIIKNNRIKNARKKAAFIELFVPKIALALVKRAREHIRKR